MDLPTAWSAAAERGATIESERWWSVYDDPILNRLIEEALAHNADLALAMARIDEARALLGLARADQLPEAGLFASRARTRQS
ncbi:MAG TPA: TolC family protein, partial [Burkholderiales bacterium]|nr:TolC family protein [Burkholderiales bacterium]